MKFYFCEDGDMLCNYKIDNNNYAYGYDDDPTTQVDLNASTKIQFLFVTRKCCNG